MSASKKMIRHLTAIRNEFLRSVGLPRDAHAQVKVGGGAFWEHPPGGGVEREATPDELGFLSAEQALSIAIREHETYLAQRASARAEDAEQLDFDAHAARMGYVLQADGSYIKAEPKPAPAQ